MFFVEHSGALVEFRKNYLRKKYFARISRYFPAITRITILT